MIERVLERPEIWRIQVDLPQNPLRMLNSYVICVPEGNLVIDTGFNRPECRKALWDGLNELGLDMGRTALFLTHLHSDHIGLAQDFAEIGCPIYMNPIDYNIFRSMKQGTMWPYLEEIFRDEGFPAEEIPRQATENQGRRYAPDSVFPIEEVTDGTKLQLGALELKCIHAPGHTPGQTLLYLPDEQILFSGDHILFDITPNINVWKDVPNPLEDYLCSLKKFRVLPIRYALPAHRARQEDVYGRIDQIIEHHHGRLEEIWKIISQQPSTAPAIAAQIKWSARGKSWNDFPSHQKWFAMGETLAHLYNLLHAGRAVREKTPQGWNYIGIKE